MRALRAAFPRTVPILAGFLFLGMAYGVYMHVLGFSFWYPVVMAAVIFGGSLEFVAGTLLLAPFAPVQTFFIALMIQARHLFYGLSMLEKYKGLGWKRAYLIYGLCDETFSIAYATKLPEGVDRGSSLRCSTMSTGLQARRSAVSQEDFSPSILQVLVSS